MSVGVGLMPMILVPLTFLFVLLIILVAKAPKAGAWVVGGLLLLAPVLFLRFASAGAFRHGEAKMLFVIPATFLFVLLVILLAKSPKTGAGLIIAIVVMVMAGLFLAPMMSHRRTTQTSPTRLRQHSSGDGGSAAIVDLDRVYEGFVQVPSPPALPAPAAPGAGAKPSPIWSEGVEREFEADVYASERAALKAVGRRLAREIGRVWGDPNGSAMLVLFQEDNSNDLMAAFKQAMEPISPGIRCSIEANVRNVGDGAIGVTLRIDKKMQIVHSELDDSGGKVVARAFKDGGGINVDVPFVGKPWVDNFAVFAGTRPSQAFIVARSNGTCISESEAHNQALADAYSQVTGALGRHEGGRLAAQLPEAAITTTDVLNGGFILDRFVQSFDTSAGKVWRQALLLDVSGPKLVQLARLKAARTHEVRESWARMGFSVIGVLLLIGVIYFFLNMATRGYYEWSLRIAGVVLAVVAIVSILMIVQ